MREITVEAAQDQIGLVTDFVNTLLAELRCAEPIRIQVDVVIDELFSNIVRYAYSLGAGPTTVRVDTEENPRCVIITFIDLVGIADIVDVVQE